MKNKLLRHCKTFVLMLTFPTTNLLSGFSLMPDLSSLDTIMLSIVEKESSKKNAFSKLLTVVPEIQKDASYPLCFSTPVIDKNASYTLNPCNPSILKTEDGYICAVRMLSYRFLKSGGRDSVWIDPKCKKNITRNVIVTLDKEFHIKTVFPIDDSLFAVPGYNGIAKGIFDIRLYRCSTDGSIVKFIASSHEYNKKNLSQMVYGELMQGNDSYTVVKFTPILGPDQNRSEKNWMPLEKEGSLYAYYCYDPLTICAIDCDSGRTTLQQLPPLQYDFSRFFGSAPPIDFDGGSLVLIHEKGRCNNSDYYLYVQRFVWISKTGQIEKISSPFVFQQRGIEFCCGMTVDHSEKNLVFSYGLDDEKACISTVPIEVVRSMLHPISKCCLTQCPLQRKYFFTYQLFSAV